jgi:hypothetical protein
MHKVAVLLLLGASLLDVSGYVHGHNALTTDEANSGWQLLFDGTTTNGWRHYQSDTISDGWQAIDGELRRVEQSGDIVTRQTYRNFELTLDAKVLEGGNSGVFFRAGETDPKIFLSAPEIQILDDAHHPDGKRELTSAGSNYGLHPAPRGIAHPAGEWNSIRLLVEGKQVTQWLNGTQICSYEIGSADWLARLANSKFATWPNYGRLDSGHIGLQDHGNPVSFRNIKIRVID